MLEITAEKLSGLIEGELEGNGNIVVTKLSKIEEGEKGAVSFLSSDKYLKHLKESNASVIICAESFKSQIKNKKQTFIWVKDARGSFAKLLAFYAELKADLPKGISKQAALEESCKIGEDPYIGHFVSIGKNSKIGNNTKIFPGVQIGNNVKIGNNVTIYANSTIYTDTIIGNDCVIQSGAIIGGDGFGFAPNSNNEYNKVYHLGNVIIEDHVEIGANTTIDKATLGSTIIRKGVKLDNLIQVAHNVEIGENTVIAAQTGIAGSTKIGANCMIGGQVGIVGHIVIADEVKIAAQSGIGKAIKEKGKIVQGSPAFSIFDYKKSYALFKNLPYLKKQIDSFVVK